MTIRKSTAKKRAIKEVKRKNEAAPVPKKAGKKERNDDGNNVLEGYDEEEYDAKDKTKRKAVKGK